MKQGIPIDKRGFCRDIMATFVILGRKMMENNTAPISQFEDALDLRQFRAELKERVKLSLIYGGTGAVAGGGAGALLGEKLDNAFQSGDTYISGQTRAHIGTPSATSVKAFPSFHSNFALTFGLAGAGICFLGFGFLGYWRRGIVRDGPGENPPGERMQKAA